MLSSKTVTEFVNEVASSSPAPGGGSVAALGGAIGAALSSMVCRLTIGKKKYADVQNELEIALKRTEELRHGLMQLLEDDTEAFNDVMKAFGLPKETDEQKSRRNLAIQSATKSATKVPLEVMKHCAETIKYVKIVAEKGNKNSASDACVAALMLRSGCEGAFMNVKINLLGIDDQSFKDSVLQEAEIAANKVWEIAGETLVIVNKNLS